MSREIYLVGSVPMANARDVFANVSAALGTLMHMQVPRNRADDTYFLPLQQLALPTRDQAVPRSRSLYRRR